MTQASSDQWVKTANPTPGMPSSSQRSKLILRFLVGFAGLAFMVVSVLFIRYLLAPRPIQEIISPGINLSTPPHYLGSIYGVNNPVGVAVSPDGDQVFISESSGDRLVRIFDRRGQEIGALAPVSTNPVERSPVYLAVNADGYVFVTDRNRHMISIYSPEGILQSEYIPGWSPLGLRLSPNGFLLVTDVTQGFHSVHQLSFNPASDLTQMPTLIETDLTLGESGDGPGQLSFPNTAVRDIQGRTYVSDGNNWRISVWDSKGNFLYNFGAGAGVESVSLPRGLAIDDHQRLYVVDASAHKIKVYDLGDERPLFLFSFGDLGTGDENFSFPTDIALDQRGRIYIADRENNRVQIWVY